MFEFSDSTRGIDAPRTVRIIRTPATGELSCCILNRSPVCHAVHWCGERTIPHTSTQPCLWCEREHVLKIEVYVAVWITASDQIRILTLTDFAAQPVLQFHEKYHDLRGCELLVHRPSGKKNGRILCGVSRAHKLSDVMPQPIEIEKHLASVWEMNILAVAAEQCAIPSGENLANLRG